MKALPVETVRVNELAKRHLSTLKRRTGIKNWNVLCRWALCISLADPARPPVTDRGDWSNVEMSWATFAGPQAGLYSALVWARCDQDGLELNLEIVAEQFRLHLHRGLMNLVSREETRTLAGFVNLAS
jgi:DNA sulfur modification protein DndE